MIYPNLITIGIIIIALYKYKDNILDSLYSDYNNTFNKYKTYNQITHKFISINEKNTFGINKFRKNIHENFKRSCTSEEKTESMKIHYKKIKIYKRKYKALTFMISEKMDIVDENTDRIRDENIDVILLIIINKLLSK